MIKIKRVYEPSETEDGGRFLIDRLWPRGIKKEALHMQGWLKEVAPADSLRRWFGHDPKKWIEFHRRYFAELDGKPDTWQPLIDAGRHGNITLLFSAKDVRYNNAVALKEYLEDKLEDRKKR